MSSGEPPNPPPRPRRLSRPLVVKPWVVVVAVLVVAGLFWLAHYLKLG